MADYNLNGVPSFKEESIMYYIGKTKLRMCYAFISTIQAFREKCSKNTIYSRERYKGHYMTFIWQSCHN